MAQIDQRDLAPSDDRFIIRHVATPEKTSWAVYSHDELYRYRLRRFWGNGTRIAFLMLNPSTATEAQNDPTVERCERRARALGYGGIEVINIFALRSTDPKGLYMSSDPIGADNDRSICEAILHVDAVLCGWGNHGKLNGRGEMMEAMLCKSDKPLFHLGIGKQGAPKHPLYIGYAVSPMAWHL